MTPDEIESFISGNAWTTAKRYPNAPHQYVARRSCRCEAEYVRFILHIRAVGYRQRFGRAYYTYFDWPVGGVIYQFWTMGVPIAREYVINRAIK
jgi:hypothetical protein